MVQMAEARRSIIDRVKPISLDAKEVAKEEMDTSLR